MKLLVKLLTTSQPIMYENALNSYVKGDMYCILYEEHGKKLVHKYPLVNIFRVEEAY